MTLQELAELASELDKRSTKINAIQVLLDNKDELNETLAFQLDEKLFELTCESERFWEQHEDEIMLLADVEMYIKQWSN